MLVPLSVGVALIFALSGDTRSLADMPACQVVLRPVNADASWQRAVTDLRTRLRDPRAGDVDCGGIEVVADGPQTSVIFMTRDGRRAERLVPAPAGLFAIVRALEVTIPESAPESQQTDPPPASPPRSPPADRAAPVVHGSAPAEVTRARFLIDGSGGVRVAGAGPYSFGSLSLGIGVGASVGHWEFGVLGQYDPGYAQWAGPTGTAAVNAGGGGGNGDNNGGTLAGLKMSTFALGLRAGRRERMGPVDGVAGLTLAIAVTDESQNNGPMVVDSQTSLVEKMDPRAGVFAGAVVPRSGAVRLRPQLAFDVFPSRITQSPLDASTGLPRPQWSTSAGVGVEWEAP
jgi:hypothetical protein